LGYNVLIASVLNYLPGLSLFSHYNEGFEKDQNNTLICPPEK